MSFTHLQVRSGYSLFNSTITIPKLVNRAKELQFNALALTDEEVMYGVIPFYQACIKQGIKPLIGMVVHIPISEQKTPVVLLAKNNDGYKNLIHISTYIQTKDELDITYLQKRAKDLICILSTETATIKNWVIKNQLEQLTESLQPLQTIFSKDNFYLGLEIVNKNVSTDVIEKIKQFQAMNEVKITALHDVRYLEENDEVSFDCLQAMKHNQKWTGPLENQENKQRHFRSKQEMEEAFSVWPEIIHTTEEIAENCNVTLDFSRSEERRVGKECR